MQVWVIWHLCAIWSPAQAGIASNGKCINVCMRIPPLPRDHDLPVLWGSFQRMPASLWKHRRGRKWLDFKLTLSLHFGFLANNYGLFRTQSRNAIFFPGSLPKQVFYKSVEIHSTQSIKLLSSCLAIFPGL